MFIAEYVVRSRFLAFTDLHQDYFIRGSMDQSAFRAMLASGSGGSRSATTSAVLGAGSRKRHHETSAAATSSSLGQFKPRAKATSGSSKGKEREELSSSSKDKDKEDGVPSYRRFGYTDRASMRRAGLAEDGTALLPGSHREEEQEERRPLIHSAPQEQSNGNGRESEPEPTPVPIVQLSVLLIMRVVERE